MPEPVAMRRFREPLMSLGKRRSLRVMELMIAIMRLVLLSSIWSLTPEGRALMPGSLLASPIRPPILSICNNCSRKSSRLKHKVETINWELARSDVTPFLQEPDKSSIELWSQEFFVSQIEKLDQLLNSE